MDCKSNLELVDSRHWDSDPCLNYFVCKEVLDTSDMRTFRRAAVTVLDGPC